jgi:hypothetical protein
VNGLRNDKWFMKGYDPVQPLEENTDEPNDVAAVFGDNEVWRPLEASDPAGECMQPPDQAAITALPPPYQKISPEVLLCEAKPKAAIIARDPYPRAVTTKSALTALRLSSSFKPHPLFCTPAEPGLLHHARARGCLPIPLPCRLPVQDSHVSEQKEQKEVKPHLMNAFELITLSQGLNLSTFFEKRQVRCERSPDSESPHPRMACTAAFLPEFHDQCGARFKFPTSGVALSLVSPDCELGVCLISGLLLFPCRITR